MVHSFQKFNDFRTEVMPTSIKGSFWCFDTLSLFYPVLVKIGTNISGGMMSLISPVILSLVLSDSLNLLVDKQTPTGSR